MFNKKEYSKRYYQEHREKMREQNKKWVQGHQEQIKQYKETHKNHIKESSKTYYQTHKEQIKQYYKIYSKQHIQSVRKWMKEHPEKTKEMERKHFDKRERKLGFIPLNEWFENSEAHHLDKNYVIYMPRNIHQSIEHSVLRNKNMDEINAVAFNYL